MGGYIVVAGIGFGIGLIVGWALGWLPGRSQAQSLHALLAQQRERTAQVDALLNSMRRKLVDTETQHRQAELTIQQLESEIEKLCQQVRAEREGDDELAQAREQIAALQSQSSALKTRLSQLEGDVVHARQRAAVAEATVRQRLEETRTSQGQVTDTQVQLERAAERIYQLERELGQAQARIQALERDAASVSAPDQVEAKAVSRVQQLEELLRDVHTHVATISQTRDETQSHADQLGDKLVQAQREREAAWQAAARYRARAEQLNCDLLKVHQRVTDLETPIKRQASDRPDKIAAQEILPDHAAVVVPLFEPEAEFLENVLVEAACPGGQAREAEVEVKAEAVEAAPAEQAQPETVAVEEVKAYCVKCKSKRVMLDPQETLLANERPALKGVCAECGSAMFRFVKGR